MNPLICLGGILKRRLIHCNEDLVQRGAHLLVGQNDKILAALSSNTINLAIYDDKYVVVCGTVVEIIEDVRVMNVTSIFDNVQKSKCQKKKCKCQKKCENEKKIKLYDINNFINYSPIQQLPLRPIDRPNFQPIQQPVFQPIVLTPAEPILNPNCFVPKCPGRCEKGKKEKGFCRVCQNTIKKDVLIVASV